MQMYSVFIGFIINTILFMTHFHKFNKHSQFMTYVKCVFRLLIYDVLLFVDCVIKYYHDVRTMSLQMFFFKDDVENTIA